MNQETLARVSRVIADFLEIPIEKVEPEAHLMDDLGLDSLAALEIVFDLEEEFGVIVPEDKTADFTTVGAVCEGIDALLALERPIA